MNEFQVKLVSELSKKYIFETFDFKNKSHIELYKLYKKVSGDIFKIIKDSE